MVDYFPGTVKDRKERKRRKRLFHRLVSGIYYNRDERLRFMTLTSSPEQENDISRDFRELTVRIRKKYGRFEYFAVYTFEGYGVMHIVYAGSFIDFNWLQDNWKEIHGAFHVNIQEFRHIYNAAGLTSYLLNQYLANQPLIRWISQSRNWVYEGYMNDWNEIRRKFLSIRGRERYEKTLSAWHLRLDTERDKRQTNDFNRRG